MLRRIMLSGVAAAAILAGSVWTLGRTTVVAQEARPPSGAGSVVRGSATTPAQTFPTAQRPAGSGDPIVIPAGRLRLIDIEDVPSQKDGVVLYIGTEITKEEATQLPPHEVVEEKVGDDTKWFRRLKEGDKVKGDQLVALVDDTIARAEVGAKMAKLNAAKADMKASAALREETKERWNTQQKLFTLNRGVTPATNLEDYRMAKVTYEKYCEEVVNKEETIKVQEQELNQARKMQTMYEIRPKISGVVKAINKHRGEAVKSLDPVLQIQNYERLRVDALLPESYANRLEKGMQVVVEPTIRESPRRTFVGHRGLVTGVAVSSKNPQKPLLVSCSDDHTIRVWDLSSGQGREREHVLKKPEQDAPFYAVACTARGAAVNLCLAGDAKGNGYLWNLDDLKAEPRNLNGHHHQAITCVVFSPDGKLCATGSQDRQIMVWDTATGNLQKTISDNHNVITALYFAPGERLISVSRDSNMGVGIWELAGDRAKQAKNGLIQRREFSVNQLGVSPDGQHVMDEQLGEMRIVTLPDAERAVPRTDAILRPTLASKKFVNFALFSPDGQLALTTPETGGLLQLWRLNFNQGRSYELRQFVSPVLGIATSAAFDPDGSFVVGAVHDRIYLWPTPGKDQIDPIPATITNIEKPIEAIKNEVRITAELDNPKERLRPGDIVTLVAYPQEKQ